MKSLSTPELYLSFRQALPLLKNRIGATKAEFACWIFFDELKAYCHVHEFAEPPEFDLSGIAMTHWQSADKDSPPYLKALDDAFFLAADVDSFDPEDRYITFSELVQRWLPYCETRELTVNFIRSRVHQSRLSDFAPWLGVTELSRVFFPSLPDDFERLRPTTEWAMFKLTEVESIEASDFSDETKHPSQALTTNSLPLREEENPAIGKGKRDKQRRQEKAILSAIRAKGFDPKKIPKWSPGAPGIKSEVRESFTIPGPLFPSIGTYDSAWERLRHGGDEAEIQDE